MSASLVDLRDPPRQCQCYAKIPRGRATFRSTEGVSFLQPRGRATAVRQPGYRPRNDMDLDPAAVQRFIADEYAFWAPLAKAASLKVQ